MLTNLLLVAWIGCQSLDLSTTFSALNRGGVEANPILGQSKTRIGGIKIAVNGGAMIAYFKSRSPRKRIISGAMAATGCVAGINNARVLR